jgi:prepilin-type N-terminal cleavage/methylation domain-containing protein
MKLRIRGKFGHKGYSLPEILVVVAVMSGLIFLGSNTFVAPQRTTITNATIDTLISEISNQQNKSMNGAIEIGTAQDNYGIWFAPTSYTTFRGASYSVGSGTNFTTNLNSNLRFSTINLPSSQVIFATSSGAIQGYSGSQNTVTIQDSEAGITKTLRFNQYGVVESLQ